MHISNFTPKVELSSQPALEAFKHAAEGSDFVHVSIDGGQFKVLGTGVTPSQRSVTWLEPSLDTTSAFVDALHQAFPRGINSAVVRELGLSPMPGQPLSSRTVLAAIDMAQTSQQAINGVDFLSQLNASATSNAPDFVAACKYLGVNALLISQESRTAIDAAVKQRFEGAAQQGTSPVPPEVVQAWLRDEIKTAVAQDRL